MTMTMGITDDDDTTHTPRACVLFCISRSFFLGCAMYDGDRIDRTADSLFLPSLGKSDFVNLKVTGLFDELEIAHRDGLLENYI